MEEKEKVTTEKRVKELELEKNKPYKSSIEKI